LSTLNIAEHATIQGVLRRVMYGRAAIHVHDPACQ
jgi:hypothetical protein